MNSDTRKFGARKNKIKDHMKLVEKYHKSSDRQSTNIFVEQKKQEVFLSITEQ